MDSTPRKVKLAIPAPQWRPLLDTNGKIVAEIDRERYLLRIQRRRQFIVIDVASEFGGHQSTDSKRSKFE